MRSHPPIAHMSHEVQGHRPAFSGTCLLQKKECTRLSKEVWDGRIHGTTTPMESRKREREKMLQDRGASPKEEGGVIREYKAMHEEHFLSSRLREDGEDKKERKMEVDRET